MMGGPFKLIINWLLSGIVNGRIRMAINIKPSVCIRANQAIILVGWWGFGKYLFLCFYALYSIEFLINFPITAVWLGESAKTECCIPTKILIILK